MSLLPKRHTLLGSKLFVLLLFALYCLLFFYFRGGHYRNSRSYRYLIDIRERKPDDTAGTISHTYELSEPAPAPSKGETWTGYEDKVVDIGSQVVIIPHELNMGAVPADLQAKAKNFVHAILDPDDTGTPRLSCPRSNLDRYEYLEASAKERKVQYFFALNLRECVDLLPRLMGSVVEAMRFLGPQNSVLSIVEGNSDDGTWEVLSLLQTELSARGFTFFLRKSDINPAGSDDRIGNLARLRSQAVEPLQNSRNDTARLLGLPGSGLDFADGAVVIFLNDVAICVEDIFELLHQRRLQEADMTCAMDWSSPVGENGPSLFYDVWIGREYTTEAMYQMLLPGPWP